MGKAIISDPGKREDRIGQYFKKYLKDFLFDEFSPRFLSKSPVGDLMKGVPVPLRREDLEAFTTGGDISMPDIARNMTRVMGCDPHFQYVKNYAAILNSMYDGKIADVMAESGRAALEKGDLDDACLDFRAALCVEPEHLYALYGYAGACRAMYEDSEDEEYIGRCKAEALEYFEMVTAIHPDFAPAYYYLGYGYLNLGLYKKADLAWELFLNLDQDSEEAKEILGRKTELKEPVQIEDGCNDIAAGRFALGAKKLEPSLAGAYKTWWPIHYYLGVAYAMTGQIPEAIASFKKVLALNASHMETMKELALLYRETGDAANARKYEQKIALIEKQH